MLERNTTTKPQTAYAKAEARLQAAVAEALARDDLRSLPRVSAPVPVAGLMEIMLSAYDRIASGETKPSE